MAWVKFVTVEHAAAALQLMRVGGYTLPRHDSLLQVDFAPAETDGDYMWDGNGQVGIQAGMQAAMQAGMQVDMSQQPNMLIYHNGAARALRWNNKEQALNHLVELGV